MAELAHCVLRFDVVVHSTAKKGIKARLAPAKRLLIWELGQKMTMPGQNKSSHYW